MQVAWQAAWHVAPPKCLCVCVSLSRPTHLLVQLGKQLCVHLLCLHTTGDNAVLQLRLQRLHLLITLTYLGSQLCLRRGNAPSEVWSGHACKRAGGWCMSLACYGASVRLGLL